jgi:hypothetical protein
MRQSSLTAQDGWPAFKGFVISGFPSGIIGPDSDEGINVKVQIRSVREQNADAISVFHWFDFNSLNGLASGFGEVGLCTSPDVACTLFNNHVASHVGDLVRGAFVLQHGASRSLDRASANHAQEKSDLPKNSNFCPINQGKTAFIGQSPKTA